MRRHTLIMLAACTLITGCSSEKISHDRNTSISGIYPHLAYYNNEGECGTGAVVPWADRLWVVTYAPHCPRGSSDKLYEITDDLQQIVRSESIGGTPANRMIHNESKQLFIGPYVIDEQRNVRVIPYNIMPGRHTGNARHLDAPADKIYYATMEEGFYSVDVHDLSVDTLYIDGNCIEKKAGELSQSNDLLLGAHGKGFYSGQGVTVYSNNGEATEEALQKFDVEAGVLAEWDGKDWRVVRRNQFTEVTGSGGIYGNANPATDPIWTVGWDYKSLIVGVREPQKGWSFYRLPKASHSYDGAHGWNTEWPRIRNIGTAEKPDYLMTMHGMFWRFPQGFCSGSSAGIRPRSAYLKVIGDFARWKDRIVFGCDDSAQKEFLNTRNAKGGIEGPGQSNSNLWFTSLNKPDELGPATAEGAVWAVENIKADEYSESFIFSGWDKRMAWIKNSGQHDVTFTLEVDRKGNGTWEALKQVAVAAGKSSAVIFDNSEKGEWVRVKSDAQTTATVCFSYSADDKRSLSSDKIYEGLAEAGSDDILGGLLYCLGNNRRTLGLAANMKTDDGIMETGYYELGSDMKLVKKDDPKTYDNIRAKFAIPTYVVEIDNGSVLITDDKGRRWRLPLGDNAYRKLTDNGELRICREVATERDLFSCMGTFYELPAENADGYAKIRPIATHGFEVNDYASYRGMLIMTGIKPEKGRNNSHIIVSDDGKAAVWAGVIDDLWTLGKPVGIGGPWADSEVKAETASDPYLIAFYDKKELTLSHKSDHSITIRVEVDPTGNGEWMEYASFVVKPSETVKHKFPKAFQTRWIRFVSDQDATATAWLEYR